MLTEPTGPSPSGEGEGKRWLCRGELQVAFMGLVEERRGIMAFEPCSGFIKKCK